MAPPPHRITDADGTGDHAYVLVGPTAVGKSAVAQQIAQLHGLGILSADSMLVYRGMDVGTAKPTSEERGEVPYWGIDLVSPAERFSAGAYLRQATKALRTAGRPLLVVGGTGLYVTALIRGLDAPHEPPAELRSQVQAWFEAEGRDGLAARLHDLAPERLAALDDPRNPRRLMRALELHLAGIRPAPGWTDAPAPRIVGLHMNRGALAERILNRVREMYAGGLLEEAARLRADHREISVTAREAIGYAEAFAVLDGRLSRSQAMERTAARTRQLAKRQMTWFRRKLNVTWVEVPAEAGVCALAARVVEEWERIGPTPMQVEAVHGE